ncbi:DNA translocase FtsK [Ligilactobacillus sp. LYQ60]|uniref:DNA translocase FtsK n=1 Tax=Ligilactobacillus sp. LYQ60 TaxID=3378799 RepID=UPI003852CB28
MARKQTTPQKKSASRKKRAKKASQQVSARSLRVSGVVVTLVAALGLFKLGFIGTLIDNVVRLVWGDAYQLGNILGLILGAFLLVTAKWPKITARYGGGGALVYFGVMLFLTIHTTTALGAHSHFIRITWNTIVNDLLGESVASSVGGGLIGAVAYTGTFFLVAQPGSYLVAGLAVIIGLCVLSGVTVQEMIDGMGRIMQAGLQHCGMWGHQLMATLRERRASQQTAKEQKPACVTPTASPKQDDVEQFPQSVADRTGNSVKESTLNTQVANWSDQSPAPQKSAAQSVEISATKANPNYQLPPISLLQDVAPTDQSKDREIIAKNQQVLQQTLTSFGVDAEIKNTILGPAVTKYELHPAIGVKVSKIVNLADDLALALAAKDIRIEAPIPGKALIGIEVPNQQVATVAFKDIISAQRKDPKKPLEVPLGRDVSGNLVTADLAKMPHLLISGSTGSGKSVAINGIITSLLMKCPPDQVKLMLVDPKKVELAVYNGIPHLLTPVVTNPKKAAMALNKMVKEMERRYDLFEDTGQRNIADYNAMVARQNADQGTEEPTLPYVVVIVDELSDLMMVASDAVEGAIIRLAQKARAAGIHMILATQRPSVDVITGLIKANVPSRMAFAVASGTDSRTILDVTGAEKLLGRGDMLFKPIDANKPVRVQGAFISRQDVENVVNFVKQQQEAEYDEALNISDEDIADSQPTESGEDALFDQVVDLLRHEQRCSVSMLQRRFKIGYNRAARIVDELEKKGIVGPQDGSKPRQVFLPKDE